MARPKTAKGTKLRIMQGNGATPEVFEAFCALTAKGINFQSQTNDFYVPDCDNPDDPAWREIAKAGLSATISGQGTLDLDANATYQAAFENENSSNYRVLINLSLAAGGGYWEGAFMLTTYEVTGNDGELVQANITLESDGPVSWVPAAA